MTPTETTLDWDRVFGVIADARLTDWDKELVGGMAVAAFNHWTEKDIRDGAEVKLVEHFVDSPFTARLDLVMEFPDGKVKLVDWKTVSGKLDERWEERQRRSWQLKLYACKMKKRLPIVGEYRGVKVDEEPLCKTVSVVITPADAFAASEQIRMTAKMLDALKDEKVWPENPGGCKCFGPMYPCPFEEYCWQRKEKPEGLPPKVALISHSAMSDFFRCPEYRRLNLWTEKEDEEKTAIGITFHAAMAEVYTQFMEERGNEKQ